MDNGYTWQFSVRTYEMAATGQVGPATLLNYLEEGAVQASSARGYDYEWYFTNKRNWVVRRMTIRFYTPVSYGDELELFTWVSTFRRVQSSRECALRRLSDGDLIARARGNWAFINTETRQPERIPQNIIEEFDPDGVQEDLDTGITEPIVVEDPVMHTEQRRVQYHELDSQGHVNHAVYLVWAEQAIMSSLRALGWPPERFQTSDFTMRLVAADIEYARSALDDEPVWVVTRLAEIGHDRAAWVSEARHGATGEMMAKIVTTYAFTDEKGPRSIPDALQLALTRRSSSV
ncbi:MAG TPA: thioesterase family protein [Aggregatilineales bacterium]|nr:thioesterase family protein [Aggregatilineales bacterium]